MEKINIIDFNESDWIYEISSGYSGYRNINKQSNEYNVWIYSDDAARILKLKKQYEYDLKLLHDFRLDVLPFGEYPDYYLKEFLMKKYNNLWNKKK